MPEAEVRVSEVKALQTRSGNTRFVLVDESGNEYSTFKEGFVASQTAIEAAPYLLSADAVEREVPPEELFDRLQPFKELVADDIERGGDEDEDAPE